MLTFGGPQESTTPVRSRRPPGGASSISLAWGDEGKRTEHATADRQPSRSSANAFANGARQNTQNVLTDKPTTRVKAPPGGRSSVCLAWEDDTAGNAQFAPFCADARSCVSSKGNYADLRMEDRDADISEEQSAVDWDRDFADRSCYRGLGSGAVEIDSAAGRTFRSEPLLDDGISRRSMVSPYDATARTPKATNREEFNLISGRFSEASKCHGGSRTPMRGEQFTPFSGRFSGASKCHGNTRTPPQFVDERSHGTAVHGGCDSRASKSSMTPRTPKYSDESFVESAEAFGQRAQRASSNVYAQGCNQNCGNVLTDTPTTRVSAPPGGRSSINLGNEDFPSRVPSSAGKPTVDINALKDLKSRMARKSQAGSTSAGGNHIYDDRYGYGGSASQVSRFSSAPGLNGKQDVEGSHPRKWKPTKALMAPPGGNPTFHLAKDGTRDEIAGRKRFADMGAGNNRDANAVEALRYYQKDERLGKHCVSQNTPVTNKHARDSHRYYLAGEGKADLAPGKSRSQQHPMEGHQHPASEQSTSVCSSSDGQVSECDSLPLGADWTTCYAREESF